LATIVDGKTVDDISLKPFTKHFAEERFWGRGQRFILSLLPDIAWLTRRFVIYWGKECQHWPVSPSTKDHGLNRGVFIAAIPVAFFWLEWAVDKDEQVQQIHQKGAFSDSSQWNHCGTRVGNARVVLRAQREQLAINHAKPTAVTQNRLGRQVKLLANVQMALLVSFLTIYAGTCTWYWHVSYGVPRNPVVQGHPEFTLLHSKLRFRFTIQQLPQTRWR
jgi:hypothetical protein